MKTNFKKLASSAAVAAALATGSMSAHAIITGVPGEAFLVPFAVATPQGNDALADPIYGELDTIVRIVVPASIGRDTVLDFTAPHTSPTNPVAGGAKELPEAAALAPNGGENIIHWTFMDSRSRHVLNGEFPVTADDVAVFDWQNIVTANQQVSGVSGYLVFQTLAGFNGEDANFSFFADAYFVTGANGNGFLDDFWSSVNIPALPLADGADTTAAPTLNNNVVVGAATLDTIVSPLVSGIRTSIVDSTNQWSVVDLELANSLLQPFGQVQQTTGSLLVVWSDRNATNWASIGVDVFDNEENRCSATISLPNELNLVWVPPASVQQGGGSGTGSNIFYNANGPSFLNNKIGGSTATQGSLSYLCDPTAGDGITPFSFAESRLNGGFVKMRLPEPKAAGQTAVEASAAAAFTINFNFGTALNPNPQFGWVSETVLGHDRGKFTQR